MENQRRQGRQSDGQKQSDYKGPERRKAHSVPGAEKVHEVVELTYDDRRGKAGAEPLGCHVQEALHGGGARCV